MKNDTQQDTIVCKPLTIQVMKRHRRAITTPLICTKGFPLPSGIVERRKAPRTGAAWANRD